MIKVNSDRCIGCMTCMTVCPSGVIMEDDGIPKIIPDKFCLRCMHCGAACPTEAITFNDKPAIFPDDIKRLSDGFTGELKNHIMNRRSYRHFSSESVPRKLIEEALQLSCWAPSAKNQHPTKWIVVDSKETVDKIMEEILKYVEETGISSEIAEEMAAGNNMVTGTAGTLILGYALEQAVSPETDTAIAMATAELYLQSKGVGTCWAGYLKRMCNDVPAVRALLPSIPKGSKFYGAFMLGYPEDEKYLHTPQRLKKVHIKWG